MNLIPNHCMCVLSSGMVQLVVLVVLCSLAGVGRSADEMTNGMPPFMFIAPQHFRAGHSVSRN